MQKKISIAINTEDPMSASSQAALEENRSDSGVEVEAYEKPPAVTVVATGPGKQWIKFYLPILQDLADGVTLGMHQLDAPRLVDVLVAFADLRVHPGDSFIKAHQRQCDAVISSFTAYQIKLMSNASSRLQRVMAESTRFRGGGQAESVV